MLPVKPCHAGLKAQSRFLGLEPLDVLLLAPVFYICSVLLSRPVAACVLTGTAAVALRLLKLGRLPGFTAALVRFLTSPPFASAFGRDVDLQYPTRQGEPRGNA